MKIRISEGQKLFPHGNFAPISVEIDVEDDVRNDETSEQCYERLNELHKALFCKKVIDSVDTNGVQPYLEKDNLIDRINELMDSLNINLIEKNN